MVPNSSGDVRDFQTNVCNPKLGAQFPPPPPPLIDPEKVDFRYTGSN